MPEIPTDRFSPGRRPRNIPRRRPPPSTIGRELGDDPYGRPGLRVAGGGAYDLSGVRIPKSIVLEMAAGRRLESPVSHLRQPAAV